MIGNLASSGVSGNGCIAILRLYGSLNSGTYKAFSTAHYYNEKYCTISEPVNGVYINFKESVKMRIFYCVGSHSRDVTLFRLRALENYDESEVEIGSVVPLDCVNTGYFDYAVSEGDNIALQVCAEGANAIGYAPVVLMDKRYL